MSAPIPRMRWRYLKEGERVERDDLFNPRIAGKGQLGYRYWMPTLNYVDGIVSERAARLRMYRRPLTPQF